MQSSTGSELIDQCSYRSRSKSLIFTLRGFAGFLLLIWPLLVFPQTTMIVYDGYTGIDNVTIQNDTAAISALIPKSPADKAGIKLHDQIIAINDSVVSGSGMNNRRIKQLLHDRSGKLIELKIKRKGEKALLSFTFQRDPYLYQIISDDYFYLVDSLEQWDILDIMSISGDTAPFHFSPPGLKYMYSNVYPFGSRKYRLPPSHRSYASFRMFTPLAFRCS